MALFDSSAHHLIASRIAFYYGYVLDFCTSSASREASSTNFSDKLRKLIQDCTVRFDSPWECYSRESVVYSRCSRTGIATFTLLYVGSTGQSTHRRELSRRRKFIQLRRNRVACYELALKIWAHQGSFYQGIGVTQHPRHSGSVGCDGSCVDLTLSAKSECTTGTNFG